MSESPSVARGDSAPTDPEVVQRYLHRHIPISQQMGVRVIALEPAGVTLCAPLTPNLNHEATAFGGSTSALAILAGWTQLYARLWSITEPRRIVIQRSAVQYLAPIVGEFCATAAAPPHDEWEGFLAQLDKHGKSRIAIRVDVLSNGVRAAKFEGDYVAVR